MLDAWHQWDPPSNLPSFPSTFRATALCGNGDFSQVGSSVSWDAGHLLSVLSISNLTGEKTVS